MLKDGRPFGAAKRKQTAFDSNFESEPIGARGLRSTSPMLIPVGRLTDCNICASESPSAPDDCVAQRLMVARAFARLCKNFKLSSQFHWRALPLHWRHCFPVVVVVVVVEVVVVVAVVVRVRARSRMGMREGVCCAIVQDPRRIRQQARSGPGLKTRASSWGSSLCCSCNSRRELRTIALAWLNGRQWSRARREPKFQMTLSSSSSSSSSLFVAHKKVHLPGCLAASRPVASSLELKLKLPKSV